MLDSLPIVAQVLLVLAEEQFHFLHFVMGMAVVQMHVQVPCLPHPMRDHSMAWIVSMVQAQD
jgi:hypothetical protein